MDRRKLGTMVRYGRQLGGGAGTVVSYFAMMNGNSVPKNKQFLQDQPGSSLS
jgi:hypothetical protein